MINLAIAAAKGEKVNDRNPWGALTLEWTSPNPPPLLNFEEPISNVDGGPYDYPDFSDEEEKH